MRSKTKSIASLFLALSTVLTLGVAAFPQDTESVAAEAKPSVALVLNQRADTIASGTAFMVGDGLVLTAEHVVANARAIAVKFPQYPAVEARLIGTDRDNDIALLSIPKMSVRPLPLADISQVREGQRIVVIGFPRIDVLGAETATVTEGIVSAVRPGFIQMQSPVNPGNSGGPVLNMKGEVVGIVRGVLRGPQQGLNFATSINLAGPLLRKAQVSTASPPPPPSPQPPVLTTELTIRIVFISSPVSPGAEATLEVQTTPGAQCRISVVYRSGPSRARGLESRTASPTGQVVWSWRVGTNTTPGKWPVFVECVLGEQSVGTETEFIVR